MQTGDKRGWVDVLFYAGVLVAFFAILVMPDGRSGKLQVENLLPNTVRVTVENVSIAGRGSSTRSKALKSGESWTISPWLLRPLKTGHVIVKRIEDDKPLFIARFVFTEDHRECRIEVNPLPGIEPRYDEPANCLPLDSK